MAATLMVEAELGGFGLGWTDITSDLADEPFQIQRGFQSSSPDDLVAAPAMLQVTLRSSTNGYYSPDSSSCRSGWGLSSRLRVKVTANSTTRTRFIGWVQSIIPTPGVYENGTVKVLASSWLKLATDTLATGLTVQTSKRGDQLLATVAAIAQFAPPGTAYDVGVDTYPYALHDINPSNSYLIDAIDSIARSGLDRIYEKADGTLVFESRNLRQTGATNAVSLSDVAPAGRPGQAVTAIPLTRSRDALWNQFLVTVHPGQIDASAVVLYSYQLSASSSVASLAAGTTMIIDGPYQDPSQKAQQVAGFNMIDNGAGQLPSTDWQITTAPNGGGADISASCTVAVTFELNKAIFTITNSSGSTGYIAKLQCRGQGFYNYQTVIGRAINTSGVSSLGRRTINVDCPYQATPGFAQSGANYLLAVWGSERSLLDRGVECFVHAGDEISLDTLLALEISSAIGVSETRTGLTGAYWVNGLTETYDQFTNTTLTFSLVPRWTGTLWRLGSAGASELGNTTVLAYI